MKFHLVSDVHVDIHKMAKGSFPVAPDIGCDYLVIAGDLGNPCDSSYETYLADASAKYKKVFLIAGNHEYDDKGDNFIGVENLIRDIANKFSNVIFLQNNAYYEKPFDEDGFRVLGCTLWSEMTLESARNVNFFGFFRNLPEHERLKELNDLHKCHKEWLLSSLGDSDKPTIVIVHHGPHSAMGGAYKSNPTSPAFLSHIPKLFQPPVKAIFSGHVHSNARVLKNGILSISNAIGYPGENPDIVNHVPNYVLEIDI